MKQKKTYKVLNRSKSRSKSKNKLKKIKTQQPKLKNNKINHKKYQSQLSTHNQSLYQLCQSLLLDKQTKNNYKKHTDKINKSQQKDKKIIQKDNIAITKNIKYQKLVLDQFDNHQIDDAILSGKNHKNNYKKLSDAIIKIQKVSRGYLIRKKLNEDILTKQQQIFIDQILQKSQRIGVDSHLQISFNNDITEQINNKYNQPQKYIGRKIFDPQFYSSQKSLNDQYFKEQQKIQETQKAKDMPKRYITKADPQQNKNQRQFPPFPPGSAVVQYSILKKSRQNSGFSSYRNQNKLQNFKKLQNQKWQQLIKILSQKIQQQKINDNQVKNLFNQIIQISKKSKQQLIQQKNYQTPTNLTSNNQQINKNNIQQKSFKKKKLQISIESLSSYKNNKNIQKYQQQKQINLLNQQNDNQLYNLSSISYQQNYIPSFIKINKPKKQKSKLDDIMNGVLIGPQIQKLLEISKSLRKKNRQQNLLVRQEEGQGYRENKKIHEKLGRRQLLEKQIIKGLQAKQKLKKEIHQDTKRLGLKIFPSHSTQCLKSKYFCCFCSIIVDELQIRSKGDKNQTKKIDQVTNQLTNQKSLNLNLNFNIDQKQKSLKKKRRIELLSPQEDIKWKNNYNNLVDLDISLQGQQLFLLDDSNQQIVTQDYDQEIDNIVQQAIQMLTIELCAQFLYSKSITRTLMGKNQFSLKPINLKYKLKFLDQLQNILPQTNILKQQMNQKILPQPLDLLRCLRVQFDDQQQDDQNDNLEEIGRYQLIINNQLCFQAFEIIKNDLQNNSQNQSQDQLTLDDLQQYNIDSKYISAIKMRQNQFQNKKINAKKLQNQLINIQIHCIFDAWNQQIISQRTPLIGFTGIGLKQLTTALRNNNIPITDSKKVQEIIKRAKNIVINILTDNKQINNQLNKDNYQIISKDSQWIAYAQQSLSCFLDIIYLIQERIFIQFALEMKNVLKIN